MLRIAEKLDFVTRSTVEVRQRNHKSDAKFVFLILLWLKKLRDKLKTLVFKR
jgi:hypothetical protein